MASLIHNHNGRHHHQVHPHHARQSDHSIIIFDLSKCFHLLCTIFIYFIKIIRYVYMLISNNIWNYFCFVDIWRHNIFHDVTKIKIFHCFTKL